MIKLFKKKISITIILVIIIVLFNTTCFATQTISLSSVQNLNQMSGQINNALSRYGHTNKTYDKAKNI